MSRHRTETEAHGLMPATKRAKRKAGVAKPTKPKGKLTAEQEAERKIERKIERQQEYALLMMPFVSEIIRGKGRDWWAVKETGDSQLDCALGEHLAHLFLQWGRRRGAEFLNARHLFQLIESMVEKGPDYCPDVRRGFLHVLNEITPEGYDVGADTGQITLLNWRAQLANRL